MWRTGTMAEDRLRVMNAVAEFSRERLAIVRCRKRPPSGGRCQEAFDTEFDIVARTLVKLLKDSPPGD